MKIIFLTDTHGTASVPSCRRDNFPEAILNKMIYIGKYIEENNIDLVIHGGDWLRTPDVSEGFVRRFSRIIKDYKCPVLGVVGNHDIYGFNPDTFNRTAFGVAEGLNAFTRLSDEPIIVGDVAVTGVDSCHELDKKGNEHLYTESKRVDGKINIHVVHGMLLNNKWDLVNHTLIDDIKDNCNADIMLTGHEHIGYGVVKHEKTTFCNPGSLARVTSSTGDIRKDVRFAVINTNNSNYDIILVNLPEAVAKSSNVIMDLEEINRSKQSKIELDNFMNKIKINENSDNLNLDIKSSLDNLCIEEEVYKECMRQIEIAEEELGK